MKLVEAEAVALRLMKKHGILEQGWTFKFDNAKKTLGKTSFSHKYISLSRYMTELDSTGEFVEQTMLHEIAHVLAGHAAGHGEAWKIKGRSIGYTGGRLSAMPSANGVTSTGVKRTVVSNTHVKPVATILPYVGHIEEGDTVRSGATGRVGTVLKINRVNFLVQDAAGTKWNFRKDYVTLVSKRVGEAPKPYLAPKRTSSSLPPLAKLKKGQKVITVPGRSKWNNREGEIIKVNPARYKLKLTNGVLLNAPHDFVKAI